MKIALGKLACLGIKIHLGGDTETAVRGALLHYVAKIKAGRTPVGLPRFAEPRATRVAAEVTLDLTVDPECEALLKSDAARQGTSVENLATRAVLLYLAELDFLTPATGRGTGVASMADHYRDSVQMIAEVRPGSAFLSARRLELDRLESAAMSH